MISGRSSDTTYEQTEYLKPGEHFLSDRCAADDVASLEHEHLPSGFPQISGSGQTVVASADDNRVVAHWCVERRFYNFEPCQLARPCMHVPFALAETLNFREWSGYYAVSAYETHHEHEYNAIRNAAALIDVSPLFKYIVHGRDAAKLVDRVITRDVTKLAVGQVYYTPWCDEHGKVIDDGTVTRLSENAFRWTAADPSLRWFTQNATGLDVVLEDVSEQVAALALQGPTSARLLDAIADADIRNLKYFRMTHGTIGSVPVDISRTGYTGDLGYEIWMPWDRAVEVWDALMRDGRPFDIRPAGMLALDVARVEAGLLLIDVDFNGSKKALIEDQTYTPFEMGLGRLVQPG
jgi:aminomethyltransferase